MTVHLPGRTASAIEHMGFNMKLGRTNHIWLASEISRLRRLYENSPMDELRAAFPDLSAKQISSVAWRYRMTRGRLPYPSTGLALIDAIRNRAFDLGYSMRDLDLLAGTKTYFQRSAWRTTGRPSVPKVVRAILALDGNVLVQWRDGEPSV